MNAPQIIFFALVIFDIGYTCAKSGQSKGVYDPIITIVADGLMAGLLWWGGFFK